MVEKNQEVTDHLTLTETQLSTLFIQIRPWVRTTLEGSEASVKSRIMLAMEGYMYAYIYSFETQISAQHQEVQVSNLLDLCNEVATLQSVVKSLAKSHILIVPLVIPNFM